MALPVRFELHPDLRVRIGRGRADSIVGDGSGEALNCWNEAPGAE